MNISRKSQERIENGLSFKEAAEIRNLYDSGMFTQSGLAELYNVSQETIYRTINNYFYKLQYEV